MKILEIINKSKKIIILIFLVILIYPMTHGRSKLSNKVTVESIRKIRLGMVKEEVIEILGKPFYVGKMFEMGVVTVYYERDFEKDELEREKKTGDKIKGNFTLCFSKPVPYSLWYPMLWVHFINGKVSSVYAKRYDFFQERGVYLYHKGKRWESDLFEETFPKGKKK